MTTSNVAVRVTAPATSANLGPGFDSLGLALDLCDDIELEAEFGGPERALTVDVEGSGANQVPCDERHLVARTVRESLDELGTKPSSLRLRCRNTVPHGRGLGSSAAAIVAGVAAARAIAGEPQDMPLMLDQVARLEGHPDNVAASLLGGLTIAWYDASTFRATRVDVHPDIVPVVCIPPTEVSTRAARRLLPAEVSHRDAAGNAARAALLVEACSRRPELMFDATEDKLHQSHREPAMPETIALVRSLRESGMAAVVSGAGPSVLVLGAPASLESVRDHAGAWDVRTLPVRRNGVLVQRLE